MSKDLPQPQQSEEVDLGQLFKLIGNTFNRLFLFIGSALNKIFLAFVWVVFFVKRHYVKIAIAFVIGFGIGLVKEKISDPIYKSSAVIKQNYKTGENLYSAIDYLNKLIDEKDVTTLGNALNINIEKASTIVELKITSVITENDKLERFDLYAKGLDSVLASTLTFDDYVANSNEFDHILQKITLKAKSKDAFDGIVPQIVKKINATDYFVNEQKKDLDELSRQEEALKEALKKSDSLQAVYQEVLIKSVDRTSDSQTSIKIDNTEDKSITKEFELYTNDLTIRRELVDIQRKKEDKAQIIEIISSQENNGTEDNTSEIFELEISKKVAYALYLGLFLFVVLLSLDFLKFLERYKEKV
jgi:hypothetical protein